MQRILVLLVSVVTLAIVPACRQQADDYSPDKIIGLERAALDRWINGDPKGYLELYSSDVTYFSPSTETRVDGLEAMTQLFIPITGKIKIDRYEMLNPKVQRYGEVAVLSYNIINYNRQPDGTETVLKKWNTTETFHKADGVWKIVHSHFSFTTAGLDQSPSDR